MNIKRFDQLNSNLCAQGIYQCISKNMDNFQTFLNTHPVNGEGGTGPIHHVFLATLIWSIDAQLVYEIGMNFGTCSLRLLNALKVTGGQLRLFEIDKGKEPVFTELKRMYPDTVSITWGSSVGTLGTIPNEIPDLIFVDGCHIGNIPLLDIKKSLEIIKKGGLIVVDDWTYPNIKNAACSVIPEKDWLVIGGNHKCMACYQKFE